MRHGQTLWNATHRWQGWADVDLDEVGVRQAEHAAVALATLLDGTALRLVSSDLLRARHTAEILGAAVGCAVSEVVPGLRERNVGEWSGKTTSEIEATWPGQLDAWRHGALPMIPGGESEATLSERINAAIRRLCWEAADVGETIVAVTHGGVIRTLTRQHGIQPRPVPNLGATWFGWTGSTSTHVGELDLLDGSDLSGSGSQVGTTL